MEHEEKGSAYQLMILILSIYVLMALLAETLFPNVITGQIKIILDTADTVICFIFIADFFMGLIRAENKREFLKWGWIDLISSIPPLDILARVFPPQIMEVLRIGRIARVLRILRAMRGARSAKTMISHAFKNRTQGALSVAATVSITLIIWGSISILIVEDVEIYPDRNISSAQEALWWSVVTITTVGYGDFYPVSPEGRIIAAILMTAGVGLFGTFTGLVASLFMEDDDENEEVVSITMQQMELIESLRDEICLLRAEVESIKEMNT
ncbi:MAG: hypothetical protein B6242_01595 [Anaerolineaceae bacterium 4572_78]|nr:MAG: hypothetical protein B6242_01595 [Anaerolineaceae bacterium 4572_78]